jgi:hypothetical protein
VQPTSPEPDAQVQPLQIDPGSRQVRVYVVNDASTGALVANILVPAVTGTFNSHTYQAGTEYWFSVAPSLGNTTRMTFTWTDYNWSGTNGIPSNLQLGVRNFTMTQGATFSSSSAPPNNTKCFVSTSLNVALDWSGLTYNPGSKSFGGSLKWYDTTGLDNVFGGTATSPQTLVASTTDSNSVSWYDAVVAVGSHG